MIFYIVSFSSLKDFDLWMIFYAVNKEDVKIDVKGKKREKKKIQSTFIPPSLRITSNNEKKNVYKHQHFIMEQNNKALPVPFGPHNVSPSNQPPIA